MIVTTTTLFVVTRDNSSESSPDEDDDCCFKITKIPRQDEIQTLHLQVTIFDPSCQEDPVHAIAFINTGAHTTIINPKILSPSMWLPHQQEFRVANSGSLTIKLKSKPIKIKLFSGCHNTTEVLGSTAPRKDLILGWDSYYAFKKEFDMSIEPRGLRWKNLYKAFTTIPRLFAIEGLVSQGFTKIRKKITTTSCADSHTNFFQKCNNPLWLNSEFFVSLPFKENIQTTRQKRVMQECHPDC